jgi:catalase
VLDEGARQRLVQNIVTSMGDSPRHIQEGMIGHWYKVHPDFGRGVAEGLGIEAGKAATE